VDVKFMDVMKVACRMCKHNTTRIQVISLGGGREMCFYEEKAG